jgi:hypothetical protein
MKITYNGCRSLSSLAQSLQGRTMNLKKMSSWDSWALRKWRFVIQQQRLIIKWQDALRANEQVLMIDLEVQQVLILHQWAWMSLDAMMCIAIIGVNLAVSRQVTSGSRGLHVIYCHPTRCFWPWLRLPESPCCLGSVGRQHFQSLSWPSSSLTGMVSIRTLCGAHCLPN